MRILITCLLGFSLATGISAQEIGKGSYRILKLDVLNFMGLGVQKVHLGYEFSPITESKKNLTTVQFDLYSPFNSVNSMTMKGGLEGGAQLRFYKNWGTGSNDAQGFYSGIGMDGGWIAFSRPKEYQLIDNPSVIRTIDHNYDRIRTGIYALIGTQARLGSSIYMDVQLGLGWSNLNVTKDPTEVPDGYEQRFWWNEFATPFYLYYEEGKSQQIYMPISFSLGYNFGSY